MNTKIFAVLAAAVIVAANASAQVAPLGRGAAASLGALTALPAAPMPSAPTIASPIPAAMAATLPSAIQSALPSAAPAPRALAVAAPALAAAARTSAPGRASTETDLQDSRALFDMAARRDATDFAVAAAQGAPEHAAESPLRSSLRELEGTRAEKIKTLKAIAAVAMLSGGIHSVSHNWTSIYQALVAVSSFKYKGWLFKGMLERPKIGELPPIVGTLMAAAVFAPAVLIAEATFQLAIPTLREIHRIARGAAAGTVVAVKSLPIALHQIGVLFMKPVFGIMKCGLVPTLAAGYLASQYATPAHMRMAVEAAATVVTPIVASIAWLKGAKAGYRDGFKAGVKKGYSDTLRAIYD